MPLPTVNLDDRRFDDLLDEAKRLIPVYCPEWTDHNASDPGIALLEVFAWMTDLMLARVNQVPQKMFITFLEMIGLQLDPPRAATAPVTFYLSAPQDTPLMIAAGTEVATIRTEVSEATVFSTEQPLTVRPPELLQVYSANTVSADNQFVQHDLGRLSLPGQKFPVFSPQPVPGDAFLLAFGADLSHHVLALVLTVEVAGGAGVNPQEPPFVWEAWQGGAQRWVPCEVEYDGTAAFNVPGDLILRLPALQEGEFFGQVGFWLRCRPTRPAWPSWPRKPQLSESVSTNSLYAFQVSKFSVANNSGSIKKQGRKFHAIVAGKKSRQATPWPFEHLCIEKRLLKKRSGL